MVPAILLAKLALDQRLQGTGLGSELLVQTYHQRVFDWLDETVWAAPDSRRFDD